jgi:lipoprotein-anchoring transpeptidase ErfK/SrfK
VQNPGVPKVLFFLFVFVLVGLLSLQQHCYGLDSKNPTASRRQIAAIQVALDNEGFSPGVIDGHLGSKTLIAQKCAEDAGLTIDPVVDVFQSWTIPQDFLSDIAPIPSDWVARSKLASMSYETIVEKIAETFHLSEEFLKTLNPKISDWNTVKEGDALKVPILNPKKIPTADHLKVSLTNKTITAFNSDDRVIALFHCSIAARKEKRPVGQLEVKVIAPDPDYLFDPALFQETPEVAAIKSKLIISPGPNNPVGAMWIGLNLKGYGMHGTPSPEAIGKTESHGCFRLTNWDAVRLGSIVKIGMPVLVEE